MEIVIRLLALALAIGALVYASKLFAKIMAKDEGTETMKTIARRIQDGAMAFLTTEYRILAIFVGIVAVVIAVFLQFSTAAAFVCGAFASGLAGWIGMHTATRAAVRTTNAARRSLSEALDISFSSGTVMGLTVVGLGLFGVTFFTWIYGNAGLDNALGFSFGASSIALFARVGGGIFTKAADVGADLVGKVEAGIPEDDPRNPAVIADNVGDNVGDVAGMGADLFESYVGSILATMILGFAITNTPDIAENVAAQGAVVLYPVLLAALGIVASILGTFRVHTDDESKLHHALFNGLFGASILLVVFMALATLIFGWSGSIKVDGKEFTAWAAFGTVVIGLFLGVIIGKVTEYYTSEQMKPAQEIAKQSQTGSATNIIYGLALGMSSTWLPLILICVGIGWTYSLAGVYGISLAAVGMLSTLGISLGVDAYGPVADNAGGLAEMAGLEPEVRKRTDALDATGNTTAAIGKGFAIGSAALTALALFNTFSVQAGNLAAEKGVAAPVLNINDPYVMIGLFIGGMLPFFFSALAMRAVGSAANDMIGEVRRQFREIKGLLEGAPGAEPDSASCVAIATKGSIRQMVAPGLLAVLAPIVVGWWLGAEALGGLLAGSLVSGVMMALFMANAGGAWDNAKKFIESGEYGGKGSDTHKAAVVGDTVGDPFKDTAGPAINILIKLMSIVALVFLPLFIKAAT
ncbi:MAG: sodium-translocating pyrophosphatase [Planctomycetes bacterium]|nr:sodium-translocating pyrophosphatase [Planctomycetota bacterium]